MKKHLMALLLLVSLLCTVLSGCGDGSAEQTPEDRARLRIQFADADEKTGAQAAEDQRPSSRQRFGTVTKADFGKKTG